MAETLPESTDRPPSVLETAAKREILGDDGSISTVYVLQMGTRALKLGKGEVLRQRAAELRKAFEENDG